jgi:hypothetical protein
VDNFSLAWEISATVDQGFGCWHCVYKSGLHFQVLEAIAVCSFKQYSTTPDDMYIKRSPADVITFILFDPSVVSSADCLDAGNRSGLFSVKTGSARQA